MQSEHINELAMALATAQSMMLGAKKEATNPFFKSRYADLSSVWEACRKPLTANGLSVVQPTSLDGNRTVVLTILLHSSGQWISGSLPIYPKDNTPQAVGSAITYARRYGLSSMVGIYQDDDDGESAIARAPSQNTKPETRVQYPPQAVKPKISVMSPNPPPIEEDLPF